MGGQEYERKLGVVEAITLVTRQCPNASVRAVAESALEASKSSSPDVLRQQVFLVLTAMRGWRGDRSDQIHRSLEAFLAD